jgi:hypothetical protein
MGILLGFAPFIVFALLTGLSVDLALWAALAAAFVIGIRDFAQTRILRVLDMGSVFLFGLLALYTGFIQPSLSVPAVRLAVDGGLMTIALASILIGNPFTLDYAREEVPEEFWRAPLFLRTNYIIAGVWVLAFAAMTAADAAATFSARFSPTLDIAASLAALAIAVVFTTRYPAHVKARAGLSRSTR